MLTPTHRLYDTDSHLKCFEATVLACDPVEGGYDIILDRTAFFPEGGGQPADTGTLGGLTVYDVRERDGMVLHRTREPIAAGTAVAGCIDWPVRFSLMQQHSGEHIVSGIIRSRFGFDNVGFHIGADCVTVDCNGVLSEADLALVEAEANEAVFANLPVTVSRPGPDELAAMQYRSKIAWQEGLRIVSIPGCDTCACCGTHVARTGEIGLVKILSGRRHKGGTRVEMLCGALAVQDYGARHRQVTDISVALSAKPLETAEAVRRLLEENESLKRQLAAHREAHLQARAESVMKAWRAPDSEAGQAWFPGIGRVVDEAGLPPAEVRRFCLLLAGMAASLPEPPAWIAVLSAAPDGGCQYAVAGLPHPAADKQAVPGAVHAARTAAIGQSAMDADRDAGTAAVRDARRIAQHLNAACSGRGGGNAALAQGSVLSNAVEAAACLRQLPV